MRLGWLLVGLATLLGGCGRLTVRPPVPKPASHWRTYPSADGTMAISLPAPPTTNQAKPLLMVATSPEGDTYCVSCETVPDLKSEEDRKSYVERLGAGKGATITPPPPAWELRYTGKSSQTRVRILFQGQRVYQILRLHPDRAPALSRAAEEAYFGSLVER